MEVVPTGTLPLLAPPSGDTFKFRKRHNDLDEQKEEALRMQIRQHIGTSVYAAKPTRKQQQRNKQQQQRGGVEASSSSSSSIGGGVVDTLGGAYNGIDVSALWTSTSSSFTISSALKFVQRLLWFSDEDMAEEIDDMDPKITAGKKFLAGVEAFAMLAENELAQLIALSELRTYQAGDIVLDDERQADGLYIILTGTAGRFACTDGSLDETAPSEVFGYQEHFGIIISPTEAASASMEERPETAIVCTSDTLECIWLSELVVRMLNIQPRMEHEFVLILHNHRGQSGDDLKSQEDILLRLLRAGLHVTVLANTRNTTNCIVLLLSAPLWLLAREDKLMAMERIVENHAEEDSRNVGGDYEYHGETMTASDRIAAFASILTRSSTDKPPGVGIRGITNNQNPIIRDIFPLHDPSMTDFILSTWFTESHSSATKRLFLMRVKDYFGLRIAFFTAFVRLYNAALVYPACMGAILWMFVRWMHYRSYVKALGIYGLCIAFIWAPSFIKRWSRYQNSLLVEWNLLGTKEVAQPNPEFRDFVVETVNVAGEGEPPDYVEVKTYDYRKRWPKYAIFALFCAICLVLMFVFVGVYVQWYIIAVMTPMCTDPRCPEFLDVEGGCVEHCNALFAQGESLLFMKQITTGCSDYCDLSNFDRGYYRCDAPLVGCFQTERGIVGTARWFYVLVQGIVLGLTLDIVFLAIFEATALGFNRWENYQTEQESERRCIEKIFLFNWVGYFYWFFLLAFVYVPNGADVQEFVRAHIDPLTVFSKHNIRFSRYWIDGLISMDSAFVTPMIVTQALNLVINTFVPYLLRRAIIKARDSYHIKKEKLSSALKMGKRKQEKLRSLLPGGNGEGGYLQELNGASSAAGGGITCSSVESESGEYNLFQEADDQWTNLADQQIDRHELSKTLAEREPITAKDLDAVVRELFGSISLHDNHMHEICGSITKDDLDVNQLTSYEWIDRVTRNIQDNNLRGVWETVGTSDDSGSQKSLKLRFITQWQCRNYEYTADRILEESSMPSYSPFGDLLHLAIQFSYTIMFSVVWPFCCLCSYFRNAVALRFDAIKMTIDCKRAVPRRTVGIGPWLGAFGFEIFVAQMIVPALFVYVSGQLDAFFESCTITDTRYGPGQCLTSSGRLAAFCSLENVGIAVCFLVYWKKDDISNQTAVKVIAHSRKLRHNLRKSVRMIGETILVCEQSSVRSELTHRRSHPNYQQHKNPSESAGITTDFYASSDPSAMFAVDLSTTNDMDQRSLLHRRRLNTSGSSADLNMMNAGASVLPVSTAAMTMDSSLIAVERVCEWREGTVSWVKNGRIKVNFSGGRKLSGGSAMLHRNTGDVWLNTTDKHVLMDPTPVRVFEVGMPVLLASKKFGRWLDAVVTRLDNKDRFGNELAYTPNEMHFTFVEAQNLRASTSRHGVDPYCVLTVHGGGSTVKHATSIKRRAVNPVWDEQVVFQLSERELYGTSSNDRARSHENFVVTHGGTTSPTVSGAGISGPVRTLRVSVFNNDPFAMHESLGDVEIDLNQFRMSGQKHRLLIPLSHKRHIWTLDAIQTFMKKQMQAADYPTVLGMPHLLVELQWLDTRLPTKVFVKTKGQHPQQELMLSRKFCETNLCYGIQSDQIQHGKAIP